MTVIRYVYINASFKKKIFTDLKAAVSYMRRPEKLSKKHVTSSFVIFFVSVFFLIKSRFGNAIYLKFVIFLLIVSFRLMSSKGSGSTFSVFNFNSSFQNNLTKTLDIELLISHHAEIREGGRSKKYFRLLI